MRNVWSGHNKRPEHIARASGLIEGSIVFPRTSVAESASAHPDRFHHTMRQVRLPILAVRNKADKTVVARAQLNLERSAPSLVQDSDASQRFSWRAALQSAFGPCREVLDLLARGKLQQNNLVGLWSAVLDQNCVLAGRERLRQLKVVVHQLHGNVALGQGRGSGR